MKETQDGAQEHNAKVRDLFEQSYPYPEMKNSKLIEAKNDALNNTIKQEMSKIIEDKEEFYDLLNKRVTGTYKVVPGVSTSSQAV